MSWVQRMSVESWNVRTGSTTCNATGVGIAFQVMRPWGRYKMLSVERSYSRGINSLFILSPAFLCSCYYYILNWNLWNLLELSSIAIHCDSLTPSTLLPIAHSNTPVIYAHLHTAALRSLPAQPLSLVLYPSAITLYHKENKYKHSCKEQSFGILWLRQFLNKHLKISFTFVTCIDRHQKSAQNLKSLWPYFTEPFDYLTKKNSKITNTQNINKNSFFY